MAACRQLRLLLWKDYLVRKRNIVTLGGVVWATMVMMALYVVRINVDNQDFPNCQYSARALPSAGMLTFVQSFICSVDNECKPMDQYQEIPTYNNSRLTQLQGKLSPLLQNDTVLEVASSVPGALKLLTTLAQILDDPTLVEISEHGLLVQDVFRNPVRVMRYATSEMNITQSVADTIMASQLNIQGILKNNIDRCDGDSISSFIRIENKEYLDKFVSELCQLTDKEIQRLTTELLLNIDFTKYISMAGNMYYKLSGDKRVLTLADSLRAVLHITSLDSYLPPVFTAIFDQRHVEFSYFNVSIITKLMDQFEPTFGKTKAYNILRDIIDTVAMGLDYLDKIYSTNNTMKDATKSMLTQVGDEIEANTKNRDITKAFRNALELFMKASEQEPIDIFKILSQITNFISKLLPDKIRHDVQFYSTLLAKLIEGANTVVSINWNIKEMAYDVSLRNPEGVKILTNLPVHVVRKGYEALADAERAQVLMSKFNARGQIFCDGNKMAKFFKISKKEADSLKSQLCTDFWKNYAEDMIKSFGIYEVKNLINNMASLMIQETFGKDTTDQLYSIDKDFQILKNFTDSLIRANSKGETVTDWNKLFNVSDESDFMKVFIERAYLEKQILITAHGALAKEVVKQNSILQYKISPFLLDLTTILEAFNAQLRISSVQTVEKMKELYPTIVQIMLSTVMDEIKTYKALSTPGSDIVCGGVDVASTYLDISSVEHQESLIATLCDASKSIDRGLDKDSIIAKAIAKIRNTSHGPLEEVNWTKLINNLKELYVKLDGDYPYLFEFTSFGMNEATRTVVEDRLREAKQFWFNTRNMNRGLHLSLKLGFRLLDLIDSEAFNVTSQGWLQGKFYITAARGPLRAAHGFITLLSAAYRRESYNSAELPRITADALTILAQNMPQLIVDTVDIVVSKKNYTDLVVSSINSPESWCGPGLSSLLPFSTPARAALRAAETFICLDGELQQQWASFIKDNHLDFYNTNSWNTTIYEPHLFLKFSDTFDAVVEDVALIRNTIEDMLTTENTTSSRLNLVDAWRYAASVLDKIDRNTTLKFLFANIDTVLNGISSSNGNESINEVWGRVLKCPTISGSCRDTWRAAWKYSLQGLSVILDDVVGDLLTYFTEINEPDASFLQLLGFTRSTGLYILYDKFPEFVGALLNSFWDYGFMVQVARARGTRFWECEAVVGALVSPVGSSLEAGVVSAVMPLVCPSVLYWISMPRNANTFLNLIAKPQYTFYNMDVQNLTSRFESAFIKSTELALLLRNISNKNDTIKQRDDSNVTLENKLKEAVDNILNYRIHETDPSYRIFNEINKKHFISTTYLTRITALVNKLAVAIESLNPRDINTEINDDELKKITNEISTMSRIFKRRPHEAIAFHFDVITDVLSTNNDSFSLVHALEATCNNLKNNDTSKDILNENQRTKNQICGKEYKLIYGAVENTIADDFENAKNSLLNMVNLLRDDSDNSSDVFDFFKSRKKLVNTLRASVKYAYDLGLPIYLKYLQSNIQSYNVVLSFLSGGDWWSELKAIYNGPRINSFFNGVERSLDIAIDILTQLDKIQIVRLLRDIDYNNTLAFCQPNVSLSEYIPDGTGVLSRLKQAACSDDKQALREIPPLMFASQGYDLELTISKDVDFASVDSDIVQVESRIEGIRDGPKAPRRPSWVSEEGVEGVRKAALGLLKGEAITKAAFGVLGNVVDAVTLFLNNSQCSLCSQLTTWVKQINLQLYKKQEYHSLLCHLPSLTPSQIHRTLKEDFHWDMALKELLSSRNYTKFELNKSLNKLLELVKLQVLEEVVVGNGMGGRRMGECIGSNASEVTTSQAATFIRVVADTITLFRTELPYLHEVEGMAEVLFLKELQSQVAPNLDVYGPVNIYLKKQVQLSNELADIVGDSDLIKDLQTADLNLRLVDKPEVYKNIAYYIKLKKHDWSVECNKYSCRQIVDTINKNINKTTVAKELPKLQSTEFWKFEFISNVLYHVENVLKHIANLVGVITRLDLAGVAEGRVAPAVDLLMELMSDETLNHILNSIHGILHEAAPLLNNTSITEDLRSLTDGMIVLQQYKNHLIKEDVKVSVGALWSDHEWLERALTTRGINNTNMWGVAAAPLHRGHIALAPLLSWKPGQHIGDFVCLLEDMSRVLLPGELIAVTLDDVLGAVADQFCGLSDQRVKEIVPLLVRGMNYTSILDTVIAEVLKKLYTASNLTAEEGERVTASLPRMATVLPSIQAPLGEVVDELTQEPLLQTLRNFTTVGTLLESSDFMTSAGNMLCGKPFAAEVSHVYRAVLQNKDQADTPDQRQLDALPTDFCRSVYKGITQAQGGKIVWSFVKPLLLGKMLYTPSTPLVHRIIQEANSTFAYMANLTSLVHSFSDAFSSVDQLSTHRQGVSVLKNLLTSSVFEDLRSTLFGEGKVPDVNLDNMFDEFGDLQGVRSILSKASSLLRCISLDRFHAAADEERLAHEAGKLAVIDEFTAGLVFLNDGLDDSMTNIRYKIRMDIDNTPTTARLKNYLWIPGPEDNFLENMRYFRGFVQIQDIIDRAIIQVARESTGRTRNKREVKEEEKFALYTQQMPYPCYRKDFFQTSLYESQALLVAFFFSLLFTVTSVVRFLVADHESGNIMLMSVMGVKESHCTMSWAIWSCVELTVTSASVTVVLVGGGILPHSSHTLLLTLIMLAQLSVLSFCYMMSKLFRRASLAAVCSGIAYLITFMPIVLILSLEAVISKATKMLICLSMSSSLCYAFLHVARHEARGVGAHWAQLWDEPQPHDLSIGLAALMIALDTVIYAAIGWTIDYFYGLKTLQSCIVHCDATEEKAGVSIMNVSKVYGDGTRSRKVALNNVSIELHRGQITTLLGHNGAGKTTLINILTGMLKPSSGHVVVRGGDQGEEGAGIGVCPQRDVLFPNLTPREHITLYAQLKARSHYHNVRDEIQNMVRALSLGGACDRRVCRLSGGTRRRLCVALAFIHAPALVTLDEPTAGVDPAARRAIWSLIVQLRQHRTILLTTHHLDEAELLSDKLVIMHKGEVHTSGSPLEIKQLLGRGYRLSVLYPGGDRTGLQHSRRLLLHAVRQLQPAATLVPAVGLDVELILPRQHHTQPNLYLQVCEMLENQQEVLGFSDYTLECSGLEQILADICNQGEQNGDTETEEWSESESKSSCVWENVPLVDSEGPARGSLLQQFTALLRAKRLHYMRNRWLSFLMVCVPALFVCVAMGFSKVRPPADNELPLMLSPSLYDATDFLIPSPSLYSDRVDPSFAEHVMEVLMREKNARNWTEMDNPTCECGETRQVCHFHNTSLPQTMLLPNVTTLNDWLIKTQELYIEKRYGGFSTSLVGGASVLVSWYNNKGHHALPAFISQLNSAILKATTGNYHANITTYSHPMKISKEPLSKDTVYQHVADAGISALVVLAYCLVVAACCVTVVTSRVTQQARLQLLTGVPPALHAAADLTADMMVIIINIVITAVLMEVFHFPVFVARNNLPAICLLIFLYGFACCSLMHVLEKLFNEPSVANMLLFCGNAFLGLGGLTVLLILDLISQSERTDDARWVLHKVFMLAPPFTLGDGLLEIAKNTIQAQVLSRFGMDTYKDPFSSDLVIYHYLYLILVGCTLFLLNLAIEYHCFDGLLVKLYRSGGGGACSGELERLEVAAERRRVQSAAARATHAPLRLRTIGNINAGFVDDSDKKREGSPGWGAGGGELVASCLQLTKTYRPHSRPALAGLTLALPAGECTALLGENGAGKSTTFSLLTGQLRPTTGQIFLNNEPAKHTQLCQGYISYCPQSDAIDPLLTVRETLSIYCQLRGIQDQNEVIRRTVDMFELSQYVDTSAGALSGGNKRKLCTAIAFMSRSPLVLLDEPTSGMDPVSRACVSRVVRGACGGAGGGGGAGGRGVLLSTHQLRDARTLCTRAALLHRGTLRDILPLPLPHDRFGGGYVVECRVLAGRARAVWAIVHARCGTAVLQLLHHAAIHFMLPTHATVNEKSVTLRLSDIFRLMDELQATCDIEDYAINQTSLDQMFLSLSDNVGLEDDFVEVEPLPTAVIHDADTTRDVTAL